MNFDRTSGRSCIPQNLSAQETIRRLLDLPIPRKFNIVRLRPADLPRGERFETVADARARREKETARFEEIKGLNHIVDQLRSCTSKARCTSVCCPLCGRRFRRWLICQALRYESDLDLEVITIAFEVVSIKRALLRFLWVVTA